MEENSIERFMSNKDKVLRLMEMDRSGELNKYRTADNLRKYEENIDNPTYSSREISNERISNTLNSTNRKSKLPMAIIESFKENPLDNNESILDEIDKKSNGKLYTEANNIRKKEMIVETPRQQTIQTTQNVDYSMIKMIVEDCLRKQLSSIKKTIISEGIGNQNNNLGELKAMKIGNKFSFITENGDVYEAKLKFIKNIKSGEN